MPTILIADDDAAHRLIIRRLLEKDGLTVFDVDDGPPLLDRMRQGGIDIIITDLFMPSMDGLELIDQVTEIDPMVNLLVITACAQTDATNYQKEVIKRGAERVFIKPYNWQELLNAVHCCLGTQPALVSGNDGETTRILVVDDDPTVQESFTTILLHQPAENRDALADFVDDIIDDTPSRPSTVMQALPDCSLEFASQGEEAIAKYQKAVGTDEAFQLVFLDVRMPPGMDGIQTAKRLKEIDSDAQIVICSAFSDYTWDQIADTVGTTRGLSFLSKPFTSEAIRGAIRNLQLA